MNGIALFTLLLATTAQLGTDSTFSGGQVGWQTENDGSIAYVIQVTPEEASIMAAKGLEVDAPIPDFLQGVAKRIFVRIGTGSVPRDPSEAELRANPRQVLPRGSTMGAGSLSTLSDRTGMTVPIDPVRVNPNPMPTAGTNRLSDAGSSIDAPPQLVQNFATNGSRSNLGNAFDSTRNGMSGSGFSGIPTTPTNNTTLPRNDLYTYTNSGPVGPTLPPGYTGGNVTISGTPTNTYGSTSNTYGTNAGTYGANANYTGTNAWNNNSTTGQGYASNAPLAGGNFGNPNNYNYSNNGNLGTVPSLNYSNSPSGSFANGSTGYGTGTNYGLNNSTMQPNAYLAQNGYQTGTVNSGVNPYLAPNATNQGFGGMGVNGLPTSNPYNNPMAPSGLGYGQAQYNSAFGSPSIAPPLLASNPTVPSPVARPTMVDGGKRTIGSEYSDEYRREYAPPSSSSGLLALLLLVSFVGNIYLIALLNQLLQRYRTLQAGSRTSTSLAV